MYRGAKKQLLESGPIDQPDSAIIVPYADGGFWLVAQFGYPAGQRVWEFPASAYRAGARGLRALATRPF